MKRLLLIFIILLSGTSLYAYSVSGRIFDSSTGYAISGVSVAVEELKATAVTSSDGSFLFENIPAGFYIIHTAHPLYCKTATNIRVKRNFTLEITLKKEVHSLDPVISSYNKNDSGRPGNQSISSDDIKYMPMSGAGDALHLLQTLPGVGSSFSLGSVPIIRGMNPIYDKTYIDDIPVDYPYHYITPIIPLLSSISGTIIDNVQIIKGPYPMTYDDSIGSIIQVKTKEVEKPGVHGSIILDPLIPLFPTIYCEAAPIADFSLMFAGRRTYLDWGADALEVDTDNEYYFQDYYLKLKYNLSSKTQILLHNSWLR